tara:strand:+ start:683 stop:1231 length:549 start_codon:yes stop_codon:yes gene_type:complete
METSNNISYNVNKKTTTQNIFNAPAMTIIAANIVCFIIFQCLFFYFIASKQFENLVMEKGKSPKVFIQNSPVIGKYICKKMKSDNAEKLQNSIDKNKELQSKNKLTLIETAKWYVIIGSVIGILCYIYSIKNNLWKKNHTFGMLLIAGCFTTELIYYLAVFKTHIVIGDWEIIKRLYEKKNP